MSTEHYIQALRCGDYVLFLDWPQFITRYYLGDNCTQDADQTISLLVYEWMQYGFSYEDSQHIAIVHALACEPDSVLRANRSYAAITLASAAMQCMVYMVKSIPAHKINFPNLDDNLIDPITNNILLIEQDNELLRISQGNPALVNDARTKINLILILEEYILMLDSDHTFNAAIRLGIVKNLYRYITLENNILSTEVQNQIKECTDKIRELNPTDSEETFFLSRIKPLPIPENKGLILNTIFWGVNFFLKPEKRVLMEESAAQPVFRL